jgi:hypothetical protein
VVSVGSGGTDALGAGSVDARVVSTGAVLLAGSGSGVQPHTVIARKNALHHDETGLVLSSCVN